ncbi:hypothetical protein BKA67DRAFT_10744 [Truncatella angustata]|uniref:Uncharacterized protein n=1 Tax=Truncatella angustata TaxID=152316 RepID=A0A9P8UWM6_9PEZI|nr:uncharacterized protein BKA67DRAFT_10744 [Truncatella angustata]KAH6659324.1 hypothetical protein BKA67DRAFT_10744 [Truncatella angustata]
MEDALWTAVDHICCVRHLSDVPVLWPRWLLDYFLTIEARMRRTYHRYQPIGMLQGKAPPRLGGNVCHRVIACLLCSLTTVTLSVETLLYLCSKYIHQQIQVFPAVCLWYKLSASKLVLAVLEVFADTDTFVGIPVDGNPSTRQFIRSLFPEMPLIPLKVETALYDLVIPCIFRRGCDRRHLADPCQMLMPTPIPHTDTLSLRLGYMPEEFWRTFRFETMPSSSQLTRPSSVLALMTKASFMTLDSQHPSILDNHYDEISHGAILHLTSLV